MHTHAVSLPSRAPRVDRAKRSMRTGNSLLIRAADVTVVTIALIAFMPLLLGLTLLVYLADPGPIFFGHERIGHRGRKFKCYKFRSMVVDADARLARLLATDPDARRQWETDHKLVDDPRITKLGRILRKSSLDELPQLWNVLRGDMSVVGPRPIVQAEAPRYGRYFADYCRVKPGLTGLWQISGRSTTTYRRRVALDVAFARSASFKLYCRIIVYTVPAVLLARGSY
jgi:exopolysaccharide production protein ExoY